MVNFVRIFNSDEKWISIQASAPDTLGLTEKLTLHSTWNPFIAIASFFGFFTKIKEDVGNKTCEFYISVSPIKKIISDTCQKDIKIVDAAFKQALTQTKDNHLQNILDDTRNITMK